jgi:hypothetical protein
MIIRSIMLDFFVESDIPKTYYGRNVIIRLHLFPYRDGRISIFLSSSCSGKVDESSFYISPCELNADSISGIKTFRSSYQLSFHRRVEQANPGSFF